MYTEYISSPIGTIRIDSDGCAIMGIQRVGHAGKSNGDALTQQCAKEMAAYFQGDLKCFSVPTSAAGTDFQKSVWKAMTKIRLGDTKTYGELAKEIGKPKAIRAVGTACGKNPLLIVQPCHRVIGSNGALGGFAAGIRAKNILLALEQVA